MTTSEKDKFGLIILLIFIGILGWSLWWVFESISSRSLTSEPVRVKYIATVPKPVSKTQVIKDYSPNQLVINIEKPIKKPNIFKRTWRKTKNGLGKAGGEIFDFLYFFVNSPSEPREPPLPPPPTLSTDPNYLFRYNSEKSDYDESQRRKYNQQIKSLEGRVQELEQQ